MRSIASDSVRVRQFLRDIIAVLGQVSAQLRVIPVLTHRQFDLGVEGGVMAVRMAGICGWKAVPSLLSLSGGVQGWLEPRRSHVDDLKQFQMLAGMTGAN